jgi:hypothetical protein
MSSGLYPIVRPQQPVAPFWMGDTEYYENMLWQVVQGDYLAYFIEMFCECPLVPDITDYCFYLSVRAGMDPNDPELCATVWNENQGQCGCTALIILPYYTAQIPVGRYAFDLKYMSPSGLVRTFARGELDVLPGTNTAFSQINEVAPPITEVTPHPPVPTPVSVQLARAQHQATVARLTN